MHKKLKSYSFKKGFLFPQAKLNIFVIFSHGRIHFHNTHAVSAYGAPAHTAPAFAATALTATAFIVSVPETTVQQSQQQYSK